MRISDWSSDVCSSDLPARDKAHDFVAATFRTNEIRLSLIKIKERLLISGKLEKPTFLNGPFDGRSLWRKARFPFPLDQFFFVVKRSEEHTSELQSLMRISYAVFCLKKKTLII